MTRSIAGEVSERKRGRARERLTMADDLREALLVELERAARVRFPSPRYRAEPVAFCREILGIEPWSRQVEVLEAVRDHPRVAVKSGHKVGKSTSAAVIALWWYCSFPDARAVMTSTTSRQVDEILWRELRMLRARGGRCVECKAEDPDGLRITRPCPHSSLIEGDQGELARTGLKSDDFREIVGFTARESEAVAGISGRNLLYIADEASGIPDAIFEAIEGNRAGGARIVLFGNPTRNHGEFYETSASKAALYKTITISSEESPNVTAGRIVVPGLATREWIEEKRLEWGEDSPIYAVRVRGKHAQNEDGKIFSLHAIAQAEQRWPVTPESGRLFIGLDPAGPSGSGDETVFATRRGLKVIALQAHRGLTDDAHLVHLLALILATKLPRETPVVVLDREGAIGAALHGLLRNFVDGNPGAFELVGVRASDRAMRQPRVYDRVRDELAANLEAWLRDGGAIPEDAKLTKELHALEWLHDSRGRMKLTPKDEVRKLLGRSPDRYDAITLSVWEPLSLQDAPPPVPSSAVDDEPVRSLDPYDGSKTWGGRRR